MQLYKVLNKDMHSPFQDFAFERGKEYICKDFDDNPNNACSKGFYATDIDGLPYTYNIHRDVWESEVGGKSVEIDQFKRRYETFKVLELVDKCSLKQLALEWELKVGYRLSEVLFPINPLQIERHRDTSDDEKNLLENWDSVRDSVGSSVWDSVGDSVGSSVGDSVGGYIGSLFPNIMEWKYVNCKHGEYPFQPVVDLWKAGLVCSYDGKIWRLHAGEKAVIVYEMKGKK